MRYQYNICLAILLLLFGACSNTRFLAEDEQLYTGQKKMNISVNEEDMKTSDTRQLSQSVSGQKPNNSMFNRRVLPPIGLWVYNYWKIDEKGKIRRWIYNALVGEPVLISDINPELRAQKIENDLFDDGYFQARAWSKVDTSARNPSKAKVEYFVEVGSPYLYKQIEFDTLIESLDTSLNLEDFRDQIKTGDQFNVSKLADARSGVSTQFQNLGYFYFNKDFIEIDADTSLGNNHLNLLLRRSRELPQAALSEYKIDSIIVYISKSSDSTFSLLESSGLDDITIFAAGNYLRPKVIKEAVRFKSGDLYSHTAYQTTLSRLNNLGVFSYVRIKYEASGPDSLANLLNARIDLIMADQISINLATDIFTKSTGYAGPGVSVGISNSNAFRGAEQFQVDLKGSIEWQFGSKEENQLGSFSYELGVNSSLTFPKLILPESRDWTKNLVKQETSVNLNFDFLTRIEYYSMFSALTGLKYSWAKRQDIIHSFSPVYLNSVSLLETTPAFDSIVDENAYIRKSFEEQFIFGMRYDFTYDNTYKRQAQNVYVQLGARSSGNLLDLLAGIGKDASERPYKILNTYYSQFVKFTGDFRYYLNGYNKTLVGRFYAGIGIPYLNSDVLPYVEQFFSGGAYSIRGFDARSVGPGSFYDPESNYIDQSGDMKLEANLEFRFGISKVTKGAFFIDTGNIWLINEDENRPGSKFDSNTFYKQLAVGAGVGLRFDFSFFVLRTDFGFPIRNPYPQDGEYWVTGNGDALSNATFYFAIGYPF